MLTDLCSTVYQGCTNFLSKRAKFQIDSAVRAVSKIAHGSVKKNNTNNDVICCTVVLSHTHTHTAHTFLPHLTYPQTGLACYLPTGQETYTRIHLWCADTSIWTSELILRASRGPQIMVTSFSPLGRTGSCCGPHVARGPRFVHPCCILFK